MLQTKPVFPPSCNVNVSANDSTIPGGYGVVFMNEYTSQDTSGSGVSDDDRYNIQYRLYNSSGGAPTVGGTDIDVTTSSSNYLTITVDIGVPECDQIILTFIKESQL